MKSVRWVLGSLLIVVSAVASDAPEIVLGPNILVSRDGDVAHVEPILAVNPRNPNNLVGAAITATRPEGGMACRTYSSLDGGSTWSVSDFPDQVAFGGGDPQVVFTPHGTVVFLDLGFGFEVDGEKVDATKIPTVVGADNGKTGVGAVFSFDGALGNLGELEAGAITGPVVLRLKLADPLETPAVQLAVAGQEEQR